ncbi:hypothetical protein CsSME_00007261 [Camellia sinensis var. sinensis]
MDEDFKYSDMASSNNETNILKYRSKTRLCGQKIAIKLYYVCSERNANFGIGANLLTQLMKLLILLKGHYLKEILRMCIQKFKDLKTTKDI